MSEISDVSEFAPKKKSRLNFHSIQGPPICSFLTLILQAYHFMLEAALTQLKTTITSVPHIDCQMLTERDFPTPQFPQTFQHLGSHLIDLCCLKMILLKLFMGPV